MFASFTETFYFLSYLHGSLCDCHGPPVVRVPQSGKSYLRAIRVSITAPIEMVIKAEFWASQESSNCDLRGQARNQGGIWGICPPENFKTLHCNMDICWNFQRM